MGRDDIRTEHVCMYVSLSESCQWQILSTSLECCLWSGNQPPWHKVLCYIWQIITGPTPLLWQATARVWFTETIYMHGSKFVHAHDLGLNMGHQTALIPWVQSVVIKHFVLGKEMLFLFWSQKAPGQLYCLIHDIHFRLHFWWQHILMYI
jgi:hypothetical protein